MSDQPNPNPQYLVDLPPCHVGWRFAPSGALEPYPVYEDPEPDARENASSERNER